MATSRILARVHRHGLRVLCGSTHNGRYWCSGELGVLHTWTAEWLEPWDVSEGIIADAGYPTPMARGPRLHTHFLQFPDGWSRAPEGSWRESRRAKQQRERGYEPTYRQRRQRIRALGIPDFFTPTEYPCRVACPSCLLVQELDRLALNVAIWPVDPGLPIEAFPGKTGIDETATPALVLDMLREDTLEWVLREGGYGLADRDGVGTIRDALIIVYLGLMRENPSRARYWRTMADRARAAREADCTRWARQLNERMNYRISSRGPANFDVPLVPAPGLAAPRPARG